MNSVLIPANVNQVHKHIRNVYIWNIFQVARPVARLVPINMIKNIRLDTDRDLTFNFLVIF